jgi:hypothetical protein
MTAAVPPVQFSDAQLSLMAFWQICESKDHLANWIHRYLGFWLPDITTCTDDVDNPPSNSSPLDFVWELYSAALDGHDEKRQRYLAYAARDSGKTLACAVFEVLAIYHLRRDVGHMAAIEPQALKCLEYIEEYLRRPILGDYVSGNNKRTIEFTWYNAPDGAKLTTKQWEAIVDPNVKASHVPETYSIKVVICTLRGANSLHTPIFVCDEVDVADPVAFREAKMIPTAARDGRLPLVLYTSSRKFAFGLMQKELDAAESKHMNVRHWNLIDITKRCPPSRHLPDEPRLPIYYEEDQLTAISEPAWKGLNVEDQSKYKTALGYQGCLKNCTIFAQCHGRLAVKPKSKSRVMKPVAHSVGVFRDLGGDVDTAKAQLMCWKPEATGLVYRYLDPERHRLTAAEMAEKLTGDIYPETFSKAELINLIIGLQLPFMSGMDHGYRHQFAVTTAAIQGINHFVINSIAITGLELDERVEVCKKHPVIVNSMGVYADPAYPADNKTFMRHGFKIKSFEKDVDLGVQNVRRLINPVNRKEPCIWFLKGDAGCEYAFRRMQLHHFKIGPDGNPLPMLDDDEADVPDSIRYLGQNTVKPRHWQAATGNAPPSTAPPTLKDQAATENQKLMAERLQSLGMTSATPQGTTYKKGNKFFFGGS